jgi:hypothetical protein
MTLMHNITVARAVERLRQAIHEDAGGPGSYRDSWLANIAMPILDAYMLDLKSPAGANKMAEILLQHFFPKPDPSISMVSPTDRAIRESKQWRADLDEILQDLKTKCTSAERSTARRKLTEAIMWLGMDLKETNATRPVHEQTAAPYPSSYDPTNARVEPPADGLKL